MRKGIVLKLFAGQALQAWDVITGLEEANGMRAVYEKMMLDLPLMGN